MFHIADQTISEPKLGLSVAFVTDPDDASKCSCVVTSEKGSLTMHFNRGGAMLARLYKDTHGEGEHVTIGAQPIADPGDPRPVPAVVNTVATISKPVEKADDGTSGKPVLESKDGEYVSGSDPAPTVYAAGGKPVPAHP